MGGRRVLTRGEHEETKETWRGRRDITENHQDRYSFAQNERENFNEREPDRFTISPLISLNFYSGFLAKKILNYF